MARTIATNNPGRTARSCWSSCGPRHHAILMTTRTGRPPAVVAEHLRGRRRGPDRHLDLSRSGPRWPTSAATRWYRSACSRTSGTGPGCRSTAPPRCSTCPRRVEPLVDYFRVHLRRAPGLGRVPPGHARAGQVPDPGHDRPLGPDRHRRLPGPPGRRLRFRRNHHRIAPADVEGAERARRSRPSFSVSSASAPKGAIRGETESTPSRSSCDLLLYAEQVQEVVAVHGGDRARAGRGGAAARPRRGPAGRG